MGGWGGKAEDVDGKRLVWLRGSNDDREEDFKYIGVVSQKDDCGDDGSGNIGFIILIFV